MVYSKRSELQHRSHFYFLCVPQVFIYREFQFLSFFLFVHSVFHCLTLSCSCCLRLLIIYDQFCLGFLPNSNAHDNTLSLRHMKISHFHHHHLNSNDKQIIEHITSRIKQMCANQNHCIYCNKRLFVCFLFSAFGWSLHAAVKWYLCRSEWTGRRHCKIVNT